MFYAMGIDSCKSGTVGKNHFVDPNNFRDNNCTHFFHHYPVESIDFFMQQSAFREHMSYAPAKEFTDTEEHIYSEVKSRDWWRNEQVH